MPFKITPPPVNTPFIENNSISRSWTEWLHYLQTYINQASTELQEKLDKLYLATEDNIVIIADDGGLKDSEKLLPAGDVVGDTDIQELANKTLDTPTIGDFSSAIHDHTSDPEGGLIEGGGSETLDSLTDTELTGPEINDLLQWDGTDWVDRTAEEAGLMTGEGDTGLGEKSKTGSVSTTNDTPADVISIDLAAGKTMTVEAWVTGRKSDGSKLASYHISGAFYRNTGGDVTQEGITHDIVAHDSSDWSVDFYVDTGTQRVNARVTGSAGDAVDWKAKVIYTIVPEDSTGGGSGLGEESETGNVQTTNDTPTDIIAIDLAAGKTMTVEAWITGRKSDGSKLASYHISGAFYRNTGGDVTQEGITHDIVAHDSSDWSIDLYVDTGNQRVNVRVTGSAGDTVDWKAKAVYTQVAT